MVDDEDKIDTEEEEQKGYIYKFLGFFKCIQNSETKKFCGSDKMSCGKKCVFFMKKIKTLISFFLLNS